MEASLRCFVCHGKNVEAHQQ
ncbi:hypothetical protein TNIN_16281, partial [Trichonephila inaurata madagascariensis]